MTLLQTPLLRLLRSPLLWIALLVAWVALTRGQDHNWDLLNYHAYNPFAWLHDRHAVDLMPAQMQSWYNPTLDLPFYWLATAPINGRWVAIWLALPAVLATWVALRIAARVAGRTLSFLEQMVAIVLMLSGAAGFSSLATTFNEWPIALGLISCLFFLLSAFEQTPIDWRRLAFAGLVGGAAVGLKLTAAVYALALGISCFLLAPKGVRLKATVAFAVAGACGAVVAGGAWFYQVYSVTGNPVFPYFNDLFHSIFAEPWRYSDDRFKPDSVIAAFTQMGEMALGARVFGELRLRDPRLLLGCIGFLIAIAWTMPRQVPRLRAEDRALLFVWLTFALGLLGWLSLHAIYRYTIFLELLVVVGGVGLFARVQQRWLRNGLLLVSLLIVPYTQRPDWGRQGYTTPFLHNTHPNLPPNSALVTLSSEALGYAAVGLPHQVPLFALSSNFIRPDRCLPWKVQALRRIAEAEVVWLLQAGDSLSDEELGAAERYGFEIGEACQTLRSTLGDLQICPILRTGAEQLNCQLD